MDIAGTPFEWLLFDERGVLTDPNSTGRVGAMLKPSVTDLVIMSHGWKTDQAGAMELYDPLWRHIIAALGRHGGRPPAGFALAGIQWPSKEYRTDFDNPANPEVGALPLPDAAGTDGDLSPAAFETVLADAVALAGSQGAPIREASVAAQGGVGPEQASALMGALKAAFPARLTNGDTELAAARAPLANEDPQAIFLDLMAPPPMTVSPNAGGSLGIGSWLGQALAGPRAAIGRVLNQFTYYEMKARAGDIGAGLGSRVLSALSPPGPIRLHLIGHSFGGRLVTSAAASATPGRGVTLQSLTLLQAAFSHSALAADFGGGQAGAFWKVAGKVTGPISATHTHRDAACTLAYALASRLVRDNAMAIGDADDQYGAIGANGLLHLAPQLMHAEQVMGAAAAYGFTPGRAHNFMADACVSGHMDVTNEEVARLVAAALCA